MYCKGTIVSRILSPPTLLPPPLVVVSSCTCCYPDERERGKGASCHASMTCWGVFYTYLVRVDGVFKCVWSRTVRWFGWVLVGWVVGAEDEDEG